MGRNSILLRNARVALATRGHRGWVKLSAATFGDNPDQTQDKTSLIFPKFFTSCAGRQTCQSFILYKRKAYLNSMLKWSVWMILPLWTFYNESPFHLSSPSENSVSGRHLYRDVAVPKHGNVRRHLLGMKTSRYPMCIRDPIVVLTAPLLTSNKDPSCRA